MPLDEFRRAGRLRHRIKITDPNSGTPVTQNSFGEPKFGNTAPIVGTFWCRVEPLIGRVYEQSMMQRWAEAKYMITMRYNKDLVLQREMLITLLDFDNEVVKVLDVNSDTGSMRPMTVIFVRAYEQ